MLAQINAGGFKLRKASERVEPPPPSSASLLRKVNSGGRKTLMETLLAGVEQHRLAHATDVDDDDDHEFDN
jgi:hypothetical protein